jgi:hypothetical protein
LLEGINKGDIWYSIFWTNGRDTWHATQSTNTEWISMWFCDAMPNVNSTIQNDPSNLFLRILPEKISGYATIALRVADNRVDRRPWSHTTVILFIKWELDTSKLEELGKNTEELKTIMRSILERQNSPLRWAEEKVTRSFLV